MGIDSGGAAAAAVVLHPEQKEVVDFITAAADQTLVCVLAGGGVGKTVMINALYTLFGSAQLNFAFTGVAASLMCKGLTVQKMFGNIKSSEQIAKLKTRLRGVLHIVVDEVSMCPLHLLVKMHIALQAIAEERDRDSPFGGLKITLVGDLVQIPAVEADNVYDTHKYPIGFLSVMNKFEFFTDEDFKVNRRSNGCPLLADVTRCFRVLPEFMPGGGSLNPLRDCRQKTWSDEERRLFSPMTEEMCEKVMREVTVDELKDGFMNTPVLTEDEKKCGAVSNPFRMLTRTNRARAAYNLMLMQKLGKELGRPVVVYTKPIKQQPMTERCKPLLYELHRFPEAFGFFLKGCSAFIVHNANVKMGLANGSGCEMVGLRWDTARQNDEFERAINRAGPGEIVMVERPELIIVKMKPHKDPEFWKEHVAAFPPNRNLCAPDTTTGKKRDVVVAMGWAPKSAKPAGSSFSFGELKFVTEFHYVEPDLAQTIWKVQGQGFPKCMVDLNPSFNALPLSWEQVYVILTRVPGLNFIRCMPIEHRDKVMTSLMKMMPSFHAIRYRLFAEEKARLRRLRKNPAPPISVAPPSEDREDTNMGNGADDDETEDSSARTSLQDNATGAVPWSVFGSVSSDGKVVSLALPSGRGRGVKRELEEAAQAIPNFKLTNGSRYKFQLAASLLSHLEMGPSAVQGNRLTVERVPVTWAPPRGMWNLTADGKCANACFATAALQCLLRTPFVAAARQHGDSQTCTWLKQLATDFACPSLDPMMTLSPVNAHVVIVEPDAIGCADCAWLVSATRPV